MDIISFSVFKKYSESNKTINEAINNYKKINETKVLIVSRLPAYGHRAEKFSRKIAIINNLSLQEGHYFNWIKEKSMLHQRCNNDEKSNSSHSNSLYHNNQNVHNYNLNMSEEKQIPNRAREGSVVPHRKPTRKDPPPPPPNYNNLQNLNKNKNNILPCTPPSSDDEKYANDNIPPPNKYKPVMIPPGSSMSMLVLNISEILIQSYPLPLHQNAIDAELQKKYNYISMINRLRKGFEYDFLSLKNDGFYYVYPQKLKERLSVYEREKIIKNKLQFVTNNIRIHKHGIKITEQNIVFFLKHYIGWKVTEKDVEFMYNLLHEMVKKCADLDGKSLQNILSYKEILICALQSRGDYNGCSNAGLYYEIRNRFGISIDLNNPYVKSKLHEICDPRVFNKRGNYKLVYKTRKEHRDVLEWWIKNCTEK